MGGLGCLVALVVLVPVVIGMKIVGAVGGFFIEISLRLAGFAYRLLKGLGE